MDVVSKKLIEVAPTDAHFDSIKKLWRANADRLGLMPDGGFQEHAAKKHLVAALANNEFAGYVMYRVSREAASIIHLCVHPDHRGQDIARFLIEELIKRTRHLSGIGLRCRVDYEVHQVWPKLGFIPISERAGRNREGIELCYWWLSHNKPDLLTPLDEAGQDTLLRAAIDANVFFDLQESRNPEALVLLEPWLVDVVELCVTDELRVEIGRNPSSSAKAKSRSYLQTFKMLRPERLDAERLLEAIEQIVKGSNSNSQSDARHLAKAAAAGVAVFITRDEDLLSISEQIEDEIKIRIVRPAQLATEIDALLENTRYQAVSFCGTEASLKRPAELDLDEWAIAFSNSKLQETRSEFKSKIGLIAAQTSESAIFEIRSPEGDPAVIFAIQQSLSNELVVPILRVRNISFGQRVVPQTLLWLLKCAVEKSKNRIRITDPFLNDVVIPFLKNEYKQTSNGEWMRFSAAGTTTLDKLRNQLTTIATVEHEPRLLELIEHKNAALVELNLWPLKIEDAEIPNYIFSIQPRWAKHLVDPRLSDTELFKADVNVALNREAIYYKAAMQLPAPFRILWYVSEKTGLCACSMAINATIEKPKELFRRYKRLGVYHWPDVFEAADQNIEKSIMAVHFRDTELFQNPIGYEKLQNILKMNDVHTQLLSPTKVSSEVFMQLYRTASGQESWR